ncbi:hypothetical protein ACVIGB_003934 [Bradyrhizobium sp. USDA 4341]
MPLDEDLCGGSKGLANALIGGCQDRQAALWMVATKLETFLARGPHRALRSFCLAPRDDSRAPHDAVCDTLDHEIGSTTNCESLPRLCSWSILATRADSTQKRIYPTRCDGLGVALFIVRQAIELLGHRMDVSSVAFRRPRYPIFAARAA